MSRYRFHGNDGQVLSSNRVVFIVIVTTHTHTHTVLERPPVTIGEPTSYDTTIPYGDLSRPDDINKCLQQLQLSSGTLSVCLSVCLSVSLFTWLKSVLAPFE